MVAAPAVSSAAGLLALLDDNDEKLQRYALTNLDKVVDQFWFQISASIASVEALYEDDEFPDRELAALLASKVFYHLGELDSALTYALGAGSLFDVNDTSDYVRTLVARALDQYFSLRVRSMDGGEQVEMDPRLVDVVERMISRCCTDGQYEQAVGIAMEGRRLDKLEEIIRGADDMVPVLKYSLRVCQSLVSSRSLRQQVMRLLVRLYEAVPQPDWLEVCQCLMLLDDAPEVAKVLDGLLRGSKDNELLAYQIAFDLVENELQSFLQQVQQQVEALAPKAPAAGADVNGSIPAAGEAMETDVTVPGMAAAGDAGAEETDVTVPGMAAAGGADAEAAAEYGAKLQRLRDVLSGKTPISLYLEFLSANNKADLQVLKNIKSAVDARISVTHSATILANAYMHAGTSVDAFLRENLDWLSRATNWAKFSATASLGLIHKGQLQQGRTLMGPYLPRAAGAGGPGSSVFSEGGALYALGLIHANHGGDVQGYLLEALRGSSNEVVQHGACLGLGLAALGTGNEELAEELKNVLYTDSAVAGEAAGMGMGLLLAGTASDKAQELLAYAHDTQHEKIIRGISLGLALMVYGREEGADALIEQMSREQDPILRYGAMLALGLAYRGTDNNAAIQKLLHFAVTDVSDDVRRAAVMCLGFVLMGVPQQCPKIVALLAESFNPHVRYGAAMAVGLACAGSGLKEAVALLEPMLKDPVDFVRQGVMVSLALVLVAQPEARVGDLRQRFQKCIEDKHEEVMARMGAIMAQGILDAGGRNACVALRSRAGFFRRTSVVGLAVFTQYWYWHPLSYCLGLAFQPSAMLGVAPDLRVPRFEVDCSCKPSLFALPEPLSQQADKQVAKVEKAVLSTTVKAKERQRKKEAEKAGKEGASAMDTDKPAASGATAVEPAAPEGEKPEGAEGAKKKAAPEPSSYSLTNPSRVAPGQAQFVAFKPDSRWQPVKSAQPIGILVLRDTQPGQPAEYLTTNVAGGQQQQEQQAAAPAAAAAAAAPAPAAAASEPEPPAPFEFNLDS